MPAIVKLTISKGSCLGKCYEFYERQSCIVGRSPDCYPQLPDDEYHKCVSRHHCLFDINPPDITVRDFGSLNGTHVNGKKIGQRESHQTPDDGAGMGFPEWDLKDGDEVELGDTVLKVGIHVPVLCQGCGGELPCSHEAIHDGPWCPDCLRAGKDKQAETPNPKVCAQCGKDVSREIGDLRQGEFLCGSCQSDPYKLVQVLLSRASRGDNDACAIQGYTIIEELGRGGMGAVYLARHGATDREVALKIMLPQVALQERSKTRFLMEAANTKVLNHPNIVRLYEAGCSNGTFFFTLEYCNGGSTDGLMSTRGGKLTPEEAMPIVFDVLDGLEYAHMAEVSVKRDDGSFNLSKGLVHRDIKPHNILLVKTPNGHTAKIADFGLAKAFDFAGLSGRTCTGVTAGSPWFMPRQQVINFKYSKPDVDVWATAASLYYMLTGRLPRPFRVDRDPWQTVMESNPIPIRDQDKSIPRDLAKVIDVALQDRRGIHFQTAAEFKEALKKAL
jgi:serine/threonine-protein kinase